MSDRLAVLPQYFLPKYLLTAFAGLVANDRGGRRTTRLINWFVKKYHVNMQEAANPDTASYANFNEFFTRALRADARPITTSKYACPVDGAISEFGNINEGQIFQAKGHYFSATALVGGDASLAAKYHDGQFANIYLSPRDYHRIHMPCDGRLKRMIYVPGELFSVNPTTARGVPGLFARNERVVCVFDSPYGEFVLVLVGATVVGSMQTTWHGIINPPRSKQVREWNYAEQNIVLKKGEEMGRFLLGSTVVMLFNKDSMQFNPNWKSAGFVQFGEEMGA
ncbi:archaetidylserine decarboxylase [Undibacterium flavidum]|uniref:Phosphatidylserine decarboxylase proenzyme n=1 Tax=Undibacterium flavidum TaxID=2762297 RepID=A0ABR6Y707_9BURK|nr:archaetidylserine decarboxylase [Undibacterium flavidum]MBC3872378.1 phosphatidylserine decarboxylase [Undibacterium flavidum]